MSSWCWCLLIIFSIWDFPWYDKWFFIISWAFGHYIRQFWILLKSSALAGLLWHHVGGEGMDSLLPGAGRNCGSLFNLSEDQQSGRQKSTLLCATFWPPLTLQCVVMKLPFFLPDLFWQWGGVSSTLFLLSGNGCLSPSHVFCDILEEGASSLHKVESPGSLLNLVWCHSGRRIICVPGYSQVRREV